MRRYSSGRRIALSDSSDVAVGAILLYYASTQSSSMPNTQSSADAPIPYLERIRTYYGALGYGPPYEWARFTAVPFARLRRPLRDCSVALVTTAAPYQPDKGDQGPGAAYNAQAKFFSVYSGDTALDHDLRIAHVAIDRAHTRASDPGSYFPLPMLRRAAQVGRIGRVAPRFHGLPTNRSQRATCEVDCVELLARCRADAVDAAILVPNCPVCHQSVALAAHALEAAGIATVIMGCAEDLVEHIGVPRFLFSDFPLGNSAGRPHDPDSQQTTLALALGLLEAAEAPRTTWRSPLRWNDDPSWKLDYCNIERLSAAEIAQRRAEFDRGKDEARKIKQVDEQQKEART